MALAQALMLSLNALLAVGVCLLTNSASLRAADPLGSSLACLFVIPAVNLLLLIPLLVALTFGRSSDPLDPAAYAPLLWCLIVGTEEIAVPWIATRRALRQDRAASATEPS